MNDAEALAFAQKHVATWNSHDLEAIVDMYSETVELHSPLAAALRGDGAVRGREQLRDYFAQGLQKYPTLQFQLVNTFLCRDSITLLFHGAGGKLVCEVLFVDRAGKVERVYAHYLCQPSA
jgi:hypothetical protein